MLNDSQALNSGETEPPWTLLDNARDLLTTATHTRDFLGSRYGHINDRIGWLALVFGLSVLAWIPIDYFTLGGQHFGTLCLYRLALAGAYFGLAWWRRRNCPLALVRIKLLLLALLPSLFYLACRQLLSEDGSGLAKKIYDFYPFVIAAQMAIFPLAFVEGIILAGAAYACIGLSSDYLLAALWLLSLLTVISCCAQLSQLHMLLQLYRQATRDPLTGLYNRRMLMSRLAEELSRANRYQRPLSILLFDLDRFKRVNDNHGHQTGDRVLQSFARIVDSSLRKVDLVGRYGGEEFLAVLPETDSTGATELAERIRKRCHREPMRLASGDALAFSASIGVATNLPAEALEELVNRADEALYRAKDEGRDMVVVAENKS